MRGLISINFINTDSKVNINDYPIVLYYNGDKSSILPSIINDEQLIKYMYNKFSNPSILPYINIYAVTYFTDDDKRDTKEEVNKYMWKLEDIYVFSSYPDLKYKILNDILIEITKTKGDNETLIKLMADNGLIEKTIINFIRYKAKSYNLSNENVTELINTVYKLIRKN